MCFRKSFFFPKIFTNIWHEINLMRHNELFSCCSYVLWPHPVPSYIIFYHKSWRPQNCYNCVLCPHHFSTHSDKLVSHKTWNSRKSLQIRSLNYQVWQKKSEWVLSCLLWLERKNSTLTQESVFMILDNRHCSVSKEPQAKRNITLHFIFLDLKCERTKAVKWVQWNKKLQCFYIYH